MSASSGLIETVLANLAKARVAADLTPEALEADLKLAPGWIRAIEQAEVIPDLEVLASLAAVCNTDLINLIPKGKAKKADTGPNFRGRCTR